MHSSNSTPSIVPTTQARTVYLVLDDFGKVGREYRETEYDQSDLESTISDLIAGQYNNPVSVIAFILRRADLAY